MFKRGKINDEPVKTRSGEFALNCYEMFSNDTDVQYLVLPRECVCGLCPCFHYNKMSSQSDTVHGCPAQDSINC